MQMTIKQRLFVLLQKKEGYFVSGEELAAQLKVSRNAVWKAVCALREDGHAIAAVTRKGYCLTEEGAQIEEGRLCAALEQNRLVASVTVLEQADSTNRVAKELSKNGAPEGTLVVAKRQSMGKGRLGRSFFSPEGGIYMSMVLRPELPAQQAVMITTCAAVAVARAMEKESGLKTGIKWVNDIFVQGKKVCGILTEAGLDFETGIPEYVVLGIGINVERQPVPEELKEIVGCLEDFSEMPVEKNRLIAAVWNEFAVLYQEFFTAAHMKEYKERSILIGREVTVLAPEGEYMATVRDIDENGHLIVECEGTKRVLSSGEVSLRLCEKEIVM